MATNEDVYHPEWLALENAIGGRQTPNRDVEGLVADFTQMGRVLATQWPPVENLTVTEETIEPEGFKARIYKPQIADQDLPVMIYFHGGGFISGDIETEDQFCRRIAVKTPCIIINVEYGLWPKYNMDQIIESSLGIIEWTKSRCKSLTTSSTLLLGGGSAGATLALQLTYHFSRQTNPTTTPSGLLLVMPIASPTAKVPYTGKYASMNTSAQDKAHGAPMLNNDMQVMMMELPKMDMTSSAHFPLLDDSLHGFPRTYIVTAEHDPARDDGRVLAKRLADENQQEVVEICYEGMPHWFQWFAAIPTTHVMIERTAKAVKWMLGGEYDKETGTLMHSS